MNKENNQKQEKNDNQIWDDMLESEDGKLALEHLLKNADFEAATGKTTDFNTDSPKKIKR